VAVDLSSGEITWRYAARRGGTFHVRRAGKLCIVATGETALTALDVVTGEVVWRTCDSLHFSSHAVFGGDSLLAVAGGGALLGRGGARLHHVDAWSGATRWVTDLPSHASPVGPPLLASETAIVVAHGPRGTALVGVDLERGDVRFDRIACTGAASCLVVDDQVIVNSESGELCAIDAASGATRWRHVLPGGVEGDRPRRLEPVLRNGALFVPQGDVHVVRPRDGTLIGRIEADLVPDLLRVDERCDVYVAEESGHIAAFGAGPRLSLVRSQPPP
jgi:outer membrane protein assembly factor BamB